MRRNVHHSGVGVDGPVRVTGMDSTTIREHYTHHVYGVPPGDGEVDLDWELVEQGSSSDGVRRQIRLDLTGPSGEAARLTLLVHLPAEASVAEPVPAFCGMNFHGNHVCTHDPAVIDLFVDHGPAGDQLQYAGSADKLDPAPVRGNQEHRWAFPTITGRGYASITWCYRQMGPEGPEVFDQAPHRLFSTHDQDGRDADEWGSIGIWAWSMSRVLDAVVAGMVPEIDPGRVIAHGHSRLGKTAIWAGVSDPRFAAVISNNSGCLGASLSRNVGEIPEVLDRIRPYWFAPNFHQVSERWLARYDGAEDPELPDQPDLMGLVAPRPLYVASASADHNADPEGEYLSWQQASAAWDGGPQATAGPFPSPGTVLAPEAVPLGYHLREGKHDVHEFDWVAWMDFADRWVR